MAEKVSDYLLKRLSEWGIKRIFGYPGDGILGIMGALERHPDLFQFVQVRHEEMAAFMASGHAKFTGELGVCMATSGPGAIHLLKILLANASSGAIGHGRGKPLFPRHLLRAKQVLKA